MTIESFARAVRSGEESWGLGSLGFATAQALLAFVGQHELAPAILALLTSVLILMIRALA